MIMFKRVALLTAVLAMASAAMAAPPTEARADRSPSSPYESPLAAVARPMWQTNNVVWALDNAHGVLYAGGSFTTVRPPGAKPGSSEQPQAKLAAFDIATGEFLASWRPNLDGTVF